MAGQPGSSSDPSSEGFLQLLKNALAAVSSGIHTRLELAVTEIEEERERLKQTLLLTLFLFFGLSLGIILLTIFIVAIFWERGWVYALGGLTLVYLGIGVTAGWMLRRKILARQPLLSVTLAELAKDRDRLRTASRE